CPNVFEMDGEQISVVIADPVPSDFEECAEESRDSCPTEAISIKE
ncbi:ferredoxin, partial [Senegalia sp. (in: firmicutes)]